MKKHWIWPILWAAVIAITSNAFIGSRSFTASASQAIGVSKQSFDSFWDAWWWLFVKGYHFGEFALLFLFLRRALHKASSLPYSAAAGWALGISALYAATDEFHQSFISYRGGRVSDVMIDCGGIAFAALVSWWLYARAQSRNSTGNNS